MSSCTKRILVFGAGGLVPDVIEILKRTNGAEVAGLVINSEIEQREAHGYRVFHWDEVKHRADEFIAVNSIGRPRRHTFIRMAETHGFRFATLIDPSAVVFSSATISNGAVIGAGVIVAAEVQIGEHVVINRAASIGHHTIVERFSTVQAGVHLGGYGQVGEDVEIGIGATVIERITIGRGSRIAAGAVVVRNCPPDTVMVGVPAKPRGETLED